MNSIYAYATEVAILNFDHNWQYDWITLGDFIEVIAYFITNTRLKDRRVCRQAWGLGVYNVFDNFS